MDHPSGSTTPEPDEVVKLMFQIGNNVLFHLGPHLDNKPYKQLKVLSAKRIKVIKQ